MHIGIHLASIPEAVAGAKTRLVLNLGLYNDFFSIPEIYAAILQCLSGLSFKNCHILTLPDLQRKSWVDGFMSVLRPGFSPVELEHEINASRDLLVRLAATHPGQVNIHEIKNLCCTPVIIADKQIFFSQYCCSIGGLYQGFWSSINIDTEKLFDWAEKNVLPHNASPREVAAFRLVQTCHFAMRGSKRMLL